MTSAARRSLLIGFQILTLALGGCAIHEQTQSWNPRYEGVPAEAGDIGLRNVLVVASDDGRATVLAKLANDGDEQDELVDVRVADTAATLPSGSLDIPSSGYATLGPDHIRVDVSGVNLQPGLLTDVEFRFENAPRTSVQALVQAPEGKYAQVEFPPSSDSTATVEPAVESSDD